VMLPVRADACGEVVLPVAVPVDPRWAGFRLDAQAAMLAPCGQLGLAASAGLEMTLLR